MSARVLLGEFGGVAQLGLREFLDGEGFEIEQNGGSLREISERTAEMEPDVVLIDLGEAGALTLAARLAATFPGVKVIACSLEQPLMHVFPAYQGGASYVHRLDPDGLSAAVRARE